MNKKNFLAGILVLSFAAGFLACGDANDPGTVPAQPSPALSTTKSPTIHITAWASVSSGTYHTCAIDSDYYYPWCWGWNSYGQLGSGNTAEYITPHMVSFLGMDSWAQISAGQGFSCARKTIGEVWCWGDNNSGQVGDGTTIQRWAPVQVGSSTNWLSVNAGGVHACGLLNNHTIWCWGNNGHGQMGNGIIGGFYSSPVKVRGTNWKSLSTGGQHTCAIKKDGTLWCWGHNDEGMIGNGNLKDQKVPVKITTANDWASVAGGDLHTCAKKKDGSLWCWGQNTWGQLGIGKYSARSTKPVKVGKAKNWNKLELGGYHSCAMKKDTGLYCWGYNGHGQLGMGNTTDLNKPHIVGNAGTGYLSFSSGWAHTCGLWNDNNIYCWGLNEDGRLGDGTTVNSNYPLNTVVMP